MQNNFQNEFEKLVKEIAQRSKHTQFAMSNSNLADSIIKFFGDAGIKVHKLSPEEAPKIDLDNIANPLFKDLLNELKPSEKQTKKEGQKENKKTEKQQFSGREKYKDEIERIVSLEELADTYAKIAKKKEAQKISPQEDHRTSKTIRKQKIALLEQLAKLEDDLKIAEQREQYAKSANERKLEAKIKHTSIYKALEKAGGDIEVKQAGKRNLDLSIILGTFINKFTITVRSSLIELYIDEITKSAKSYISEFLLNTIVDPHIINLELNYDFDRITLTDDSKFLKIEKDLRPVSEIVLRGENGIVKSQIEYSVDLEHAPTASAFVPFDIELFLGQKLPKQVEENFKLAGSQLSFWEMQSEKLSERRDA